MAETSNSGSWLTRKDSAETEPPSAASRPSTAGAARPASEHYELGRLVGVGGMAVVYEARDKRTGQRVAVKQLRPELAKSPQAVHRFRREARHMRKLAHPRVLPILEIAEGPEGPFLVTPFLERGSLADLLAPGRPLAPELTVKIARQVAEALDHADKQGLMHGDVKPGNVLLDTAGDAVLADFGLARATFNDSMLDVPGAACAGTLPYLSPAVVRGEVEDGRRDIYALGALLYAMLTGQPPYSGTEEEIRQAILSRPPRAVSELNPAAHLDLAQMAATAMARELRDRYARMAYLLADLVAAEKVTRPKGAKPSPDPARVAPAEGVAGTPERGTLAAAGQDYRDALMPGALQREPTAEMVVSTVTAPFARTHFVSSPDYNELVLAMLHQAADRGDHEAQSKLGAMYVSGDGVPVDYGKGLRYLRKAADANNALALYNLGVMHAHGSRYGIEFDPVQAFACYLKAAGLGNLDASNNLGVCYQNGVGCVRDLRAAFEKYREAAERGHAVAISNCGYMKELGLGTPADTAEALRFYRQAAERGCLEALYNLGRLLIFTETIYADFAAGREALRQAGERGSGDAFNLLGCMEYKGFQVPRNYLQAREYFEMADDLDNAPAKNNLGWLYQHGYGVKPDLDRAVSCYTESAELGYSSAQCNLGFMYYNGLGVPRDFAKALHYFRLAAQNDNLTGRFNLALLHLAPEAGCPDRAKALSLLKRCAWEGNGQAQALLEKLLHE